VPTARVCPPASKPSSPTSGWVSVIRSTRRYGHALVLEHEHRRAAGVRARDHVERVHATGMTTGAGARRQVPPSATAGS
jgi:hypothetical protein